MKYKIIQISKRMNKIKSSSSTVVECYSVLSCSHHTFCPAFQHHFKKYVNFIFFFVSTASKPNTPGTFFFFTLSDKELQK